MSLSSFVNYVLDSYNLTIILYGVLGRPRHISGTRHAGFGHPKCLTLVLALSLNFSYGTAPFP